MTHGSIGFLDNERGLWLPDDILRPLSIRPKTSVHGVYYPRSSKYPKVPDAPVHDFMLTPVPFDLWCSLARIRIRVDQYEEHALRDVAGLLASKGLTIQFGEYTRSAHRYATYLIVAHFGEKRSSYEDDAEKIHKKIRHLDRSAKGYRAQVDRVIDDHVKRLYKEMEAKCANLSGEINKSKSTFFFSDKVDPDLRKPFDAQALTALPYFYFESIKHELLSQKNSIPARLYRPFKLIAESDGFLKGVDTDFSDIITLGSSEGDGSMVPACVFSEVDTWNANLRVAVIQEKKLYSFASVVVPYERKGSLEHPSSQGLMREVLQKLPATSSLLHLVNHSERDSKEFERGQICFTVQDSSTSTVAYPLAKQLETTIKSQLKGFLGGKFAHIELGEPTFSPLVTPELVEAAVSLRRKTHGPFRYDVFISYDHKHTETATNAFEALKSAGVEVFLADRSITSGDDWIKVIRSALLESQELFLICSSDSLKSTWVATEWGTIWALGRTVTPLLVEGMGRKSVKDERIKMCQFAPSIKQYVRDVKGRTHGSFW